MFEAYHLNFFNFHIDLYDEIGNRKLKLEMKVFLKVFVLFYSIIEFKTAAKLDQKQKDNLLLPTEFEG